MKTRLVAGVLALGLVIPNAAIGATVFSEYEQVENVQIKPLEIRPLRVIGEKLGFTIQWDNEKQEAVVTKGDFHSVISVKNQSYEVNEVKVNYLPAPQLIDSVLHASTSYVDKFITQIEVGKEEEGPVQDIKELVEGENRVKVGEEFAITLEVNPSTGYHYIPMIHQPMDIAQLVKAEGEVNGETSPELIGAPTEKTWLYRAENPGTVYIDFNLYAPGQPTEPVKTIRYTVHIEQ